MPQPETEQETPFDPKVDPIGKIDALLEEAKELERQLWERHKAMKRSGTLALPGLGGALLGNVRAWNEKVLALADEHLPLREAADVDALPGWTSTFANTQRIGDLLTENSRVLVRIRQVVEARTRNR